MLGKSSRKVGGCLNISETPGGRIGLNQMRPGTSWCRRLSATRQGWDGKNCRVRCYPCSFLYPLRGGWPSLDESFELLPHFAWWSSCPHTPLQNIFPSSKIHTTGRHVKEGNRRGRGVDSCTCREAPRLSRSQSQVSAVKCFCEKKQKHAA